jgi:tetratricopeptide (TPR) repeat protein
MQDNPFLAKFPELRPGEKPSLGNVYGIGTTLVGRRDYDPDTGTYVATCVFSIFFIPLLALSSYRVADAPGGGWYCLGRVPLSGGARRWNIFFMLFLLAGATGIWWYQHTKSPEYIAARKLEEVDRAVAAGQGGQAAKLCREVMDSKTSKVDEAKKKLAGLLDGPPGEPSEATAVYAVAVDLHRENRCPVPDLVARGTALAKHHADVDPAAALALLEVISPFATDTEAELALRRELLEKLLAKNPDDLETASRLAMVYEAKGDLDRCEKLLVPFEKRLGTTDGAAVLGRIYATRGENDRAYALLRPYVDARLSAFRKADETLRTLVEAKEKQIEEDLKTGKAKGFDFAKAQQLPKAQAAAMVDEYVLEQFKKDANIEAAQKRLIAERGVVNAALDLGLVQLQRAQAMTDSASRKAELEAAEKTFLSIRGVAGKSDQYRLTLGQVYYWLGRPAEGKKLFDELLASQNQATQMVCLVANTFREVGDDSEARRLLESAYSKETDLSKKQQVATFRSLVFTDLEDEILWLGRSNPDDPHTQATLANSRGRKAVQDGRDDEATEQYRRSIELYEKLPVNAATLNNSALSHFAVFQVTHDKTEFTRGMDKLDRAIALRPTDSILLLNGASSVAEGALIDVIGDAVDFRALKLSVGGDVLPYLYRSPTERSALYERLTKHPGSVKARAYFEKLLTLAPKRTDSYNSLANTFDQTRDVEALKTLLVRVEKAELDHGDEAREVREFLAGKDNAKKKEDARKALTRAETALNATRANKDRTFAVAVGRFVQAKHTLWVHGEQVDVDGLVKLAEEAHAAAPSAGTESTLRTALLLRAHVTLTRTDGNYAKLAERTQRSFGTILLYQVISNGGALKAVVLANPDVKKLAALELEDFKTDPESIGPAGLLLLKAFYPSEAATVAEKVLANERLRVRNKIHRILSPYSARYALDEYWQLQLAGKEVDAKKVLTDLAAKGVPVQ